MLEKLIQDFNHRNYTSQEMIAQIIDLDRKGYHTFIGSDSQIIKRKISIVTCLCLWKEGVGNKIFLIKERVRQRNYPNLYSRMELETFRSLELATEISELVSHPITIHLDLGTDETVSKSAAYASTLKSVVISNGYHCEIKPDSWAASSVADRWAKS